MPIVSHTKEVGGGHVVVRAFDQDGREYMFSFFEAGVTDVDALIAAKLVNMDAALAEAEFEQMIWSV